MGCKNGAHIFDHMHNENCAHVIRICSLCLIKTQHADIEALHISLKLQQLFLKITYGRFCSRQFSFAALQICCNGQSLCRDYQLQWPTQSPLALAKYAISNLFYFTLPLTALTRLSRSSNRAHRSFWLDITLSSLSFMDCSDWCMSVMNFFITLSVIVAWQPQHWSSESPRLSIRSAAFCRPSCSIMLNGCSAP